MILVTGAGGFVGSHVLRRVGEGARGLVRRRSALADPPEGVELVEGDLTDQSTLPGALEGVRVVIHCAAITGDRKEPSPGAYDAVNRVGTEHLVEASRAAGVERLVVLSGLGTKQAPVGTYMSTRWGLEEAVRRSEIPSVILRPSVLFGAGAPFVGALAGLIRGAPVVPVIAAGRRFQPFWVEDLVTCVVSAVENRRLDGRTIELGGSEQLTMREIVEAIARAANVRRALVPVPLAIAGVQARLMTATLPRPPLTPAAIELFGFDNITDLDACERAFGFRARGFSEHLREHGLD